MITAITDRIIESKELIMQRCKMPFIENDYSDLVKVVAEFGSCQAEPMDCLNVSEQNFGSSSGSCVYIIGTRDDSWFYTVRTFYGTCAVCDALAYVDDEVPESEQPHVFYTMCLHIAQGIRRVEEVDLFNEAFA